MERFAIKIDKSLRANLYKICRLCGIDNPDKIKVRDDANIVNLEDGEPELWKKVLDCIGLMITKDDKMPQFMCTLCVDKINDFFEFREMCYATDGQTRKLLGIKGEPKVKAQLSDPSSTVDFKSEDIKEPIPEITPQRSSRKRRNADLDYSRDIKTDDIEDVKPSTASNSASSSATKKKRLKLSITETEPKSEPGTKSSAASKTSGVVAKKEPGSKPGPAFSKTTTTAGIVTKKEIATTSKKRLKTEPIVKENKKEVKPAKMTKLMKKKLKEESPPLVVPEEQQQLAKKKKLELVKPKKQQLVVKAEKLKRGSLDTKIKEEAPTVSFDPASVASTATKMKSKLKETCSICSEGFLNKIHLDKHVKNTHIPTIHRYHCVQCNETLKKNMEIKNHNLWHKLSKTPFKCGNCSDFSCSIYTYSKHIRDCNQVAYLDSHIPDWHCPDCSENYETTYLFNIHSCVSKKLVCPGCEKSLKWKEDYFKHIPTCSAAFSRIPPYMTSNIQVKNEAELPTSPLPPPVSTLPATTTTPLQPTPSARVTPPQMDSNQCVVIPGNIPIPTSPSKSNRKGKRITKKDLKRFDKLLKSTMTTLVSIKHEPTQGGDSAVAEGERPSSSEVRDLSESPPRSPMPFGGDDFHHNDDDTDSADEHSSPKPVGTIKQEIIDEGYRDLYNNIEVNIKHEVDANKNSADETSPAKKTTPEVMAVSEESPLAPKPILKLKITKEHGTLNSVLMDSPKSEKKKKKKKRKEDREKDERNVTDEAIPSMRTADLPVNDFVSITEIPSIKNDVPIAPVTEKLEEKAEPPMPLPGIIAIKKEIDDPEVDAAEGGESCHSTPSIIAASSGSLQISCVSEGVSFHTSDKNDEEMPQRQQQVIETNIQLENFESEVPVDWVKPNAVVNSVSVSSMEVSVSANPVEPTSAYMDPALSMEFSAAEEPEPEEIDIKPRLEDLLPMLQIASVTSGADAVEKPAKKTIKRKRCPTLPKPNPIPKIISVSSGNQAALYHPDSDASPSPEENETPSEKVADHNDNAFDFSQFKIKEEVVDPGYNEESTATLQHEGNVEDNEEVEEEAEGEEEEAELEEEEEDAEAEADEHESEVADLETDIAQEADENDQIERAISQKQAEENAYIANIDFNNLTIKQEKEYIDDGLENSVAFEEEEEEEGSSDSDSEESSDDSDSESEREYRDLPSEDEEKQISEDDEKVPSEVDLKLPSDDLVDAKLSSEDEEKQTLEDHENDKDIKEITPTQQPTPSKATQLDLQILTVHSEFSCPHLSKKTESEAMDSDDKTISTDKWQNDKESTNLEENLAIQEVRNDVDSIEVAKQMSSNTKDYPIPMEIDGQHEPMLEKISNDTKVEDLLNTYLTMEEPSVTVDFKMTNSEVREQASISEANDIDHAVLSTAEGSLQSADLTDVPIVSSEVYLENTMLPQVYEEANDPEAHSLSSCNEELLSTSVQLSSSPSTSREESINRSSFGAINLTTTDVDQVGSTVVSDICYPSQLLLQDDMVETNASNFAETHNTSKLTQPEVESNTNEVHMMSFDHFQNSIPPRSLDEVASIGDQVNTRPLLDTEQNEINQQDNVLNQLIPDSPATFSEMGLNNSHCPTQEVPLTNFDDTHNSCQITVQQNPCDLIPAADAESNTPHASTSVQSALSYHPPHDTNSALSYSMDSEFNYGIENQSTQLSSLLESSPLHVNSRIVPDPADGTTNLDSDAFDNANVLMDLGSALANSITDIDPPSNHDRQEFHLNTQFSNESVMPNIPQYSMEPSQFNIPQSSYAAVFNCKEPCSSNPSRFSEFQDLAPPTAGQLQTCLVNQPVLSGLSTNSLTNLPMLSEEVQNLLNEDTVAVSNFEFNENVLRARSSLAAADPVPNFNDFENLNEIAENNNNANIERELQDELGNVLAVAIADRTNDDEVDENNVMNENRANFDIT